MKAPSRGGSIDQSLTQWAERRICDCYSSCALHDLWCYVNFSNCNLRFLFCFASYVFVLIFLFPVRSNETTAYCSAPQFVSCGFCFCFGIEQLCCFCITTTSRLIGFYNTPSLQINSFSTVCVGKTFCYTSKLMLQELSFSAIENLTDLPSLPQTHSLLILPSTHSLILLSLVIILSLHIRLFDLVNFCISLRRVLDPITPFVLARAYHTLISTDRL